MPLNPVPLDPRLTPARPDLADAALRGQVEAARFVVGTRRRVRVPAAPLRRAPMTDAAIDTEVLMGDAVTLYEARDGFAYVQIVGDGYVGYLEDATLGPDAAPTHRVTALRTFLYPAPDLKTPPLGHLSLGARLAATGEAGDYLRTEAGYVFGGHCGPVDAREPDHAATAERLVGAPYLWGGRTSLGLDCSGLVQLCLDLAGRPCPRDADQQERALGTPLPADLSDLSRSDLRRGDLVFWRGHVGMMLDGTRLIHANGHHMAVAVEPVAAAVARIRDRSYGPVTALRRLADPTPSAGS